MPCPPAGLKLFTFPALSLCSSYFRPSSGNTTRYLGKIDEFNADQHSRHDDSWDLCRNSEWLPKDRKRSKDLFFNQQRCRRFAQNKYVYVFTSLHMYTIRQHNPSRLHCPIARADQGIVQQAPDHESQSVRSDGGRVQAAHPDTPQGWRSVLPLVIHTHAFRCTRRARGWRLVPTPSW